jgi:hypothetical protein
MRKLINILTLLFLLKLDAYAQQQPFRFQDVQGIKNLAYQEDFTSLLKLLDYNKFVVEKPEMNYSNGNYYIIAHIHGERALPKIRSKTGTYFDISPSETIDVEYKEAEGIRYLYISQNYKSEFHDFLGTLLGLKEMKWSYVRLGEMYERGRTELGSINKYDGTIAKDSIKPLPTAEWPSYKLVLPYKQVFFRNDNLANGKRCYYTVEVSNPLTEKEYFLLKDTCYTYRLSIAEWFEKKGAN